MTVELRNFTIRYGTRTAVDAVNAIFPPGAVGLLGRNGAGKSSILKSLLGLVKPTSGTMQILDLPAEASPEEVRSRIGYMPERDGHLPGMSGYEMVVLLGRLSGLDRADASRRAHEVLYLVGLDEQRYRPVSGYSTGMRQKTKLAAALVHDPAVLFLDEPTNGLDPGGREEMLKIVRHLAKDLGKSVVLSTHILQDVEATCDSVVVMEQGRMVASGPLAELTRSERVEYQFVVDPPELVLAPEAVAALGMEPLGGGAWRAFVQAGTAAQRVFEAVHAAGGSVRQILLHRRTLEEVFLGAVQKATEGGRS